MFNSLRAYFHISHSLKQLPNHHQTQTLGYISTSFPFHLHQHKLHLLHLHLFHKLHLLLKIPTLSIIQILQSLQTYLHTRLNQIKLKISLHLQTTLHNHNHQAQSKFKPCKIPNQTLNIITKISFSIIPLPNPFLNLNRLLKH